MSTNMPKTHKTTSFPKWFNPQEVVNAATSTLTKSSEKQALKATATSRMVVISYRDSHGHVIHADDPFILAQIAKGEILNDKYGTPLTIHKQIPVYDRPADMHIQATASEKRVDMRERQLHPAYMVDSTINRHIQYKAIQQLANFASSCGMYGARARYLRGKNASTAGKEFEGYREIIAEVSWLIGPRLRRNITASVKIDAAGKFEMPKVFTDADGTECPFTKDAVAKLVAGMEFEKPMRQVYKRSDIPTFRKSDPTRFRAM